VQITKDLQNDCAVGVPIEAENDFVRDAD